MTMSGFQAGRFPTQKEIDDQLVQHGNGNFITPKGADQLAGYDKFFQEYWNKGLSGSSVRNECVFLGAFHSMGGATNLKGTL